MKMKPFSHNNLRHFLNVMGASVFSLSIFFLFVLSIFFIKSNSTKQSCPSFDCGNGITIGYPFWLQSQQQSDQYFCGYQGFNVSCKEKSALFNISNNLYKIKNFNESDKTFTLISSHGSIVTDDDDNESCPVARHDVILNSSSLIDYAMPKNVVKMMHFFYNCSLYPPSVPDINCLRFAATNKHSYVFLDGKVPEFDWEKYCDSIVTVPLIDQMANQHHRHGELLANNSGRALLDGFKLTWKPDLACQSCESTGGLCGHGTKGISQRFICFCNDAHPYQQHPSYCQDSSAFSRTIPEKPNYTAIGLLIFGGFIASLTILYHIQKISSSSNGFNLLPISGK